MADIPAENPERPEAPTRADVAPQSLRTRVRSTLTKLSRTGSLPTLPGVATTALALAQDAEADLKELVRLVQTDVGLTSRILRVANSPAYGRRRKALSVSEAVTTVGLHQTCDILVAISVRKLYVAPGRASQVLWNHSLAVAVAAEDLARQTRRVRAGTAFLPGLLHDVGRIAFLMADPQSLVALWNRVDAGEGQSTELERECYEFDHAQVGGILAEDWGLTSEQCDAIRSHHDPEMAGIGQGLATLLNAADHLAYKIGHGTTARAPDDVSTDAFGLTEEEEAACIDRVLAAYDAQKDLIGS